MKVNRLAWVGIIVFCTLMIFFYGVKFLQEESLQTYSIYIKSRFCG